MGDCRRRGAKTVIWQAASGWFQLPNGMNSDNCETAADIQSWIWYYGPTSSQVYYLLGPNSNSVAFSMMYWSGYLIPTAPNTDPGGE